MAFEFELNKPDFYSARLGLIVLQSDETIEHEIRSAINSSIALYHSRIPCQPTVTPETLAQMKIDLPQAAELLPSSVDFDAIGYACTSGATVIGSKIVQSLVQLKHKDVAVTDPIDSVKRALKRLNCKKIAFVSPYEVSVTDVLQNHIQDEGFKITNTITFNEKNDSVVAKIREEDTLRAIIEANNNDCDAVFASCTNLKTFNIIEEAEKKIGKPVISSNLALIWNMFELAGIKKVQAPGILFNS
jgi:maleate isomerase